MNTINQVGNFEHTQEYSDYAPEVQSYLNATQNEISYTINWENDNIEQNPEIFTPTNLDFEIALQHRKTEKELMKFFHTSPEKTKAIYKEHEEVLHNITAPISFGHLTAENDEHFYDDYMAA